MKRRFNYTERRRIPRSQIAIAWAEDHKDNEPVCFEGSLDLTMDPPLPPDAKVYLEAYSGPTTMRFDCGTVGQHQLPEDRILTAFAPGQRPLFKVKAIAADDPLRRILARADAISPTSPDDDKAGRISILPVERVDLKDEVWRLDLNELEQPKLQLNKTISQPRDISTMANEGDFLALVYPAVIRQILTALLPGLLDGSIEEDHQWLQFGARMSGEHWPDNEEYGNDDEKYTEDYMIWIDQTAAGFAKHFEAKRNFETFKSQSHDS